MGAVVLNSVQFLAVNTHNLGQGVPYIYCIHKTLKTGQRPSAQCPILLQLPIETCHIDSNPGSHGGRYTYLFDKHPLGTRRTIRFNGFNKRHNILV